MGKPLPVIQPRARRARWYDGGLKFACTGCGNCCTGPPGYVWISEQEISKLARHLGRSVADLRHRYLRKIGGRFSLRERRTLDCQYDCVFLMDMPPGPDGQRRRGCGIYPVRPVQCRTFPFWDGIVASRRSWESTARHCPGIGRGPRHSPQQIEALRDAREWPAE